MGQWLGEGLKTMRHWLLMFRPETYELVKGHKTIGVVTGHRARFEALAPGDGVVVYVSRVQQLDAYGHVVGKPFHGIDPIFGPKSERYAHRARIELDRVGLARDAKQLLYGISPFAKLSTTPTNKLLCSGGFLEITLEDYDWLVGCMERRIQPPWEGAATST